MNMLKVKGASIVDTKDRLVRLRGFGVGGWMNSENFINGYPGFEFGLRAALAEELGPAKAEFLWDRMLASFFDQCAECLTVPCLSAILTKCHEALSALGTVSRRKGLHCRRAAARLGGKHVKHLHRSDKAGRSMVDRLD